MRILIITMNVGVTAPGIVFERIIHGLSASHEIDIAANDFSPSVELSNVRKVTMVKSVSIRARIDKLFVSAFNLKLSDKIWATKAIAKLNRSEKPRYDYVFSLMSFNHYGSLIAGHEIAKKLNIKHIVYSVDAVPAPIGWLKDDLFYRGTKNLIAKYFSDIDILFSANQKMLDYQLKIFKPKSSLISGVVFNPSYGDFKVYENGNNNVYSFLYTGGIYGPRKAKYLLEAFKIHLQKYPSSKLEFVGTTLPDNDLSILDIKDREKVIFYPFDKNLVPYYERATALIDIDADLPDDVFLSSKITNYININRIIISETGDNSPSRHIFKNIPSIIQCGHDAGQLAQAMEQAIKQRNSINYEDRSKVIGMFSLNSVVAKINSVISS